MIFLPLLSYIFDSSLLIIILTTDGDAFFTTSIVADSSVLLNEIACLCSAPLCAADSIFFWNIFMLIYAPNSPARSPTAALTPILMAIAEVCGEALAYS